MGNKVIREEGHGVAIAGGFFRIVLYICIIFVIIYAGKMAYTFGYSILNQEAVDQKDGKDVTVVIKDKVSVYKIGKVLESKGLVKDAKVFVVQEMLSNYKDKLKPGTYILNTTMTPDELMAVISQENTEGQPQTNSDTEEKTDGASSDVYDKVSQNVEAGDTAEDAQNGEAQDK